MPNSTKEQEIVLFWCAKHLKLANLSKSRRTTPLKKSGRRKDMKDLLESLEIGEEKVKLSKEEIKTILAKNGEIVKTETEKVENNLKTEIETYKTSISELEDKMKNLPKTEELETLQAELKKIQDAEAERIANESKTKEEEVLTNNIINVFGDKAFTSDYVKNGLISDIKTELAKAENKGKGISEIFETLTKDKEGIFVNPNTPPNMDGANPNMSTNVTKEAFTKMGYKERLALKQENPDLYQSFLNEK